jgi:hypothetical protein
MRFHEDPAFARADPARLDEFTGSCQLPAIERQGDALFLRGVAREGQAAS